MSINSVSSVSFKACIPVKYFAKDPDNDEYLPVIKNDNIKKFHRQLVTNLNGTAKGKTDFGLIKFYRGYDSDYAYIPAVHSVYGKRGPVVHMVTGRDVDVVNQMAKPVGIAKGQSVEVLGHSKSFDAKLAAKCYQQTAEYYVKNNCKKVKSKDNNHPLELHMYFNPEYGKRNGQLKGFNFVEAKMVDAQTQEEKGTYSKEA